MKNRIKTNYFANGMWKTLLKLYQKVKFGKHLDRRLLIIFILKGMSSMYKNKSILG